MIITDIKRQKKREQRYSVYVDGTYVFALDELDLSASPLRIGLELTQAEIDDWRQRSSASKAYDGALRFLSYRQRSTFEIKKYLTDKEHDAATIASTLERLTELGLVNDLTFARAWIADRNRMRPRSRQALSAELYAKGIDRDTIDESLSELDRDTELTALRSLIARKSARYDDRNKLIAYLSSRGYSYGLVKEAIELELTD